MARSIHPSQRRPGESRQAHRARTRTRNRAAMYGRNAKARKALGRINRGAPREGDDAKINRLAEAYHARPQPKFPKERKRKQRSRHLRDQHGAYTLTGGEYFYEGIKPTSRDHVETAGQEADGTPFFGGRRKWLAGISEQRGY